MHRVGDGFFFCCGKGLGKRAGDFASLLVYPSSLRMTLDSTSTFTFSFGWNGWFWASLLASMRSDDVYLPSEKRKRPRGKSLEWPCGQGPSLRFGTRGAPLSIYILSGFGWFPSFVGASERFVGGIVAPHCADIGPSAESSDSPCVSFLPQFQCVQYNPTLEETTLLRCLRRRFLIRVLSPVPVKMVRNARRDQKPVYASHSRPPPPCALSVLFSCIMYFDLHQTCTTGRG